MAVFVPTFYLPVTSSMNSLARQALLQLLAAVRPHRELRSSAAASLRGGQAASRRESLLPQEGNLSYPKSHCFEGKAQPPPAVWPLCSAKTEKHPSYF